MFQENVKQDAMLALNKLCGVKDKDDIYKLIDELLEELKDPSTVRTISYLACKWL